MANPLHMRIPASKLRPIQCLKPDYWWLGDYEGDDGEVKHLWSEVSIVMEFTLVTTGAEIVRVLGTATDGTSTQVVQRRGFAVESVTEAQARKTGLRIHATALDPEGSA